MANVTITITVSSADLNRLVDAVSNRYGWTDAMGVTKAQFTKNWLGTMLKNEVKTYETSIVAFTPPDITVG